MTTIWRKQKLPYVAGGNVKFAATMEKHLGNDPEQMDLSGGNIRLR